MFSESPMQIFIRCDNIIFQVPFSEERERTKCQIVSLTRFIKSLQTFDLVTQLIKMVLFLLRVRGIFTGLMGFAN